MMDMKMMSPRKRMDMEGSGPMKKMAMGGSCGTKKMMDGGKVKSGVTRADGIAVKGHTKGRMI